MYIVSNQAGTYAGTIKLVDVANDDEVIAEQDISIVVEVQEAATEEAASIE